MPALTATAAATVTPAARKSAGSGGGGGATDDGSLRKALLDAFPARLLTQDSPVLASLVSLLRVYATHLSAEDLYYKTEAVLMADRVDRITNEIVEQVRHGIARDWESAMSAKTRGPGTGTPAKNGSSSSSSSSGGGGGGGGSGSGSGSGSHYHSGGSAAAISTPASKLGQQQRTGLGSYLGISPNTPSTPRAIPSKTPGPVTPASVSRTTPSSPSIPSSGPHTIETLNPQIVSVSNAQNDAPMVLDTLAVRPAAPSSNRVALAIGTDPRTWNYRYMFERPGVKGQALDEAVESTMRAIIEGYNLTDEDLEDPSMPSQESVYVVGRIAPAVSRDAKVGTGQTKLSEGLMIETSRRIGSGSRTLASLATNVKVRPLKDGNGNEVQHSGSAGAQLGLFPGLIAGFRGRNGGGEAFIIEEILMPPPLPLPATTIDDLTRHQHAPNRLNGEPLQVYVASGPFTHDRDLDFRPWHRLMDQVEQQLPDVLLLLGPFLPTSNAALMDPELAHMPNAIFERHISHRLNRLCEKTARTTAILLPSTRDIVSPHAAWPQPMLDKSSLGLHKRVKCLPNPCLFSINEVIVGASTVDVLRDLRSEELLVDLVAGMTASQERQTGERDAMARTVRHVLHQRHFYPLYPASTASEVPLDVSHAKLAAFTGVSPDILLLPSVLTPFAKIVDGSVVVNPGQTARGGGGGGNDSCGTCVKLQVQPMAKDALQRAQSGGGNGAGADDAEEVRMQHSIYDRTRVDIVRL